MSPLDKDEEKDEQAVGHTVILALKSPKVLAFLGLLAFGGWREYTRHDAPPVEAFTADEMRSIVRKEIAPLRAGIEELAKAESAGVQVKVLQAMIRAERRQSDGVQ